MSESVEALAEKVRAALNVIERGDQQVFVEAAEAALDALLARCEQLYMEGHAQGFEDGTEAAAADVRAAEADGDRYKDALKQSRGFYRAFCDGRCDEHEALRRMDSVARAALDPEQQP